MSTLEERERREAEASLRKQRDADLNKAPRTKEQKDKSEQAYRDAWKESTKQAGRFFGA